MATSMVDCLDKGGPVWTSPDDMAVITPAFASPPNGTICGVLWKRGFNTSPSKPNLPLHTSSPFDHHQSRIGQQLLYITA